MRARVQLSRTLGWNLLLAALTSTLSGCQTVPSAPVGEPAVNVAVSQYITRQAGELADRQQPEVTVLPGQVPLPVTQPTWIAAVSWLPATNRPTPARPPTEPFTLGAFPSADPPDTPPSEETTVTTRPVFPPEGYWRQDVWHQMGHEAASLATHDFWRGFKSSYWSLPNTLLLGATMGGSIAIRETGVDDTVRNRTHGSRALGDMSETIQIIGNPGTHFAAAGVLWLVSDLTKDVKEHEVAKALTQALAVNGASTLVLKAAANTRGPDNAHFAWPSGHTSSVFTAAAVLNEYYGPWVGIPSFAMAGLVGYQRVDAREHDFSDVVFGAMLGYVIGTSVARDDKAQFPELFGMQVIPYVEPDTGTTGLALLKQF